MGLSEFSFSSMLLHFTDGVEIDEGVQSFRGDVKRAVKRFGNKCVDKFEQFDDSLYRKDRKYLVQRFKLITKNIIVSSLDWEMIIFYKECDFPHKMMIYSRVRRIVRVR